MTYCQADWDFFSKIMPPFNSFSRAASTAGIGLLLLMADNLEQMKKKQKFCKIHLDLAIRPSKMVSVETDV